MIVGIGGVVLIRPDNYYIPILKGYKLDHDHTSPRETLKGKTPSEAAGIKVDGSDKWMTIIQNASLD